MLTYFISIGFLCLIQGSWKCMTALKFGDFCSSRMPTIYFLLICTCVMCTIRSIIVELFWPCRIVRQIIPIVIIVGNKMVMMDNMWLQKSIKYMNLNSINGKNKYQWFKIIKDLKCFLPDRFLKIHWKNFHLQD